MFKPIIDIHVEGEDAESICVIFPSFPTNWDTKLENLVSELTNVRLLPNRILFVCPFGQHDALIKSFKSKGARLRDRLRATSHVVVATYGREGTITVDSTTNLWSLGGSKWVVQDDFVVRIANEYLARLCEATNTVLNAPAGYQFVKPSRSPSIVFLRAGNMLREIDSTSAYTHLLLRRCRSDTASIFIDSSTVLSFAMALQEIIKSFACNEDAPLPTIENFRSYDGVLDLQLPKDGRYLVIISASTSGNLARKIVETHSASWDKIVHLIGAGADESDSDFRSSCIYFRKLPLLNPPRGVLDDIHIVGEEFIPSYAEPRRVPLTIAHIDEQNARVLTDSFYQSNLTLRRKGEAAGYGSYSLFSVSNSACALDIKELDDWILDRLIHEIPASVSLVVHLADDMSIALAQRIRGRLPNLQSTTFNLDEQNWEA